MCIGTSQQILWRIRPAVAGTLAATLFDQPACAGQLTQVLANHFWMLISLRLQINIAYLTQRCRPRVILGLFVRLQCSS